MRYCHFFWDFDGTLYDTYGRITRATVNALHALGAAADFDAVYAAAKRSLHASYLAFAAPLGIAREDFLAQYHAFSGQEGPESYVPIPAPWRRCKGSRKAAEAIICIPIGGTARSNGSATMGSNGCLPTG